MSDVNKKPSDLRKNHNSELIRRMRGGESLTAIDSKASWYPPRPIIQKDYKEMSRLYKADVEPVQVEQDEQRAAGPEAPSSVLRFPKG